MYKTMMQLSPLIKLQNYIDVEEITNTRAINASVVNISGRQRMLSQRIALFSLRLVCTKDQIEREDLRIKLLSNINLMERSHHGLIKGDKQMKLPGKPSEVVKRMYFESPVNLDQKLRSYLKEAQTLAQAGEAELNTDNKHLKYIQKQAEKELLEALDAMVTQYQKESEDEQLSIDIHQAYQQSASAHAALEVHAEKLEKTLAELKETQSHLIQKEKMSSLGELLAGVAHEINNPISFIKGNLHHTKEYFTTIEQLINLYHKEYSHRSIDIHNFEEDNEIEYVLEDLSKILDSMEMSAERICEIVSSLKNFSHSEQNHGQQFDIHQGIDSTLLILFNRFKGAGTKRKIELIKDYGKLPLVECYPGQLNQVFMNIISNAIDVLESVNLYSVPTITIKTELLENGYIRLRIGDNGGGISEDIKDKLFEPFFTTKPIGKGTGLGLSISYQIIVEKHKGKLGCVSELGKGTEFIIEIPVKR